MIAFQNVADVLAKSLEWEQKLKDLYEVAEFAMRGEESKSLVSRLRQNLEKKLTVLRNVKPSDHGSTEWVRYAPDAHEQDFIDPASIKRDSSPEEILTHIVNYESRLREFYTTIADRLVSRDQKELFESLARFKGEQIAEFGRITSPAK